MYPVLKPTLRRRWRDAGTLQLGTDPAVAMVLTGLRSSDRIVLDLLDGTRTEPAVLRAASESGVPADAALRLLGLLRRAGALEDAGTADPLAEVPFAERERFRCELAELSVRAPRPGAAAEAFGRRHRSTVVLLGGGRLGAPIAALLAAAGIGAVEVSDLSPARPEDAVPGGLSATDAGRPRQDAVAKAGSGARIRRRSGSPTDAALVVLAPPPGPDPTTAERLRRDGVPHLAVDIVDGAGIVGPLVLPARSACLRCLDAHRRDRDVSWVPPAERMWPETGGAALTLAIAALATMQVLTFLDEPGSGIRPAVLDGTIELRPPDWRVRRRTWALHPDCGCAG